MIFLFYSVRSICAYALLWYALAHNDNRVWFVGIVFSILDLIVSWSNDGRPKA